MNSFSTSRLAVTLLMSMLANALFGGEPPLSVEEVGRILGYPADKLKVEDVTDDWNRRAERKGKPGGISAHVFRGDDRTFARLSIGIANEGTLLTDDVKTKLSQAITGMKNSIGTNLHFKWLSFEDAGYGVSGLGMVGAGGSDERSIMTLVAKMDVQIAISKGEDPLEVLPGAEDYHRLVHEGGINQKLTECLSLIASKVTGKPITAVASDELPKILETALNTTNPSPQTVSYGGRVRAPERPVDSASNSEADPSPNGPSSSSSRLWWGIVALTILAFLGWFLLKRRPI
jgi:hypothetical protein